MNPHSKRMKRREPTIEVGARPRRSVTEAPAREAPRTRPSVVQFFREVRDELRQVAWPTRVEVVNYTTIVFSVLVLMTALIFLLNYAFGKGVLFMFQK